jgi:hypothetical protein
MRRLFAAVFAETCVTGVIGSTPGFARGAAPGIAPGSGVGIGGGSGVGIGRGAGAGIGRGARLRQMPAMQNRIPAPLPPPSQPPVINGPLQQSPSGLPPMGGGM